MSEYFGDGPTPPAPKMPPLRTFKVSSWDPTEGRTRLDTFAGHIMSPQPDGALLIVEMQVCRATGMALERIVQIIPTGEWDRAWEDFTPSSTIMH
jgi:hypothetical protein